MRRGEFEPYFGLRKAIVSLSASFLIVISTQRYCGCPRIIQFRRVGLCVSLEMELTALPRTGIGGRLECCFQAFVRI
jgi:hypothetical protein